VAEWDNVGGDLRQRINAIRSGLFIVAQAYAGHITSDMRKNAQWRNHSGDARGGLTALPYQEGEVYGITAFHTAEYGRWLELGIDRWATGPDLGFRERTRTGRMGYPIIANTMREYWPRYLAACREVIAREGGQRIG
jgi:hypothetical protein